MVVLGADFDYLRSKMITSAKRGSFTKKDATHARSLIRSLFALVEGIVFTLKLVAIARHLDRGSKGPTGAGELVFEERYDIDSHGEIVTRSMKIPLERNLRFAFRFFATTFGVRNELDTQADWWHAFRRCEAVRDRLMHPRSPEDLELLEQDIVDASVAENGFRNAVAKMILTMNEPRTPAA